MSAKGEALFFGGGTKSAMGSTSCSHDGRPGGIIRTCRSVQISPALGTVVKSRSHGGGLSSPVHVDVATESVLGWGSCACRSADCGLSGEDDGRGSSPSPARRRRPARYIHLPPPPPTAGPSSSSPPADLPEQEKPPGPPDVRFVHCPV